ncbi:MAG: LysR substrate-binding domain-containing protein [Lachnospiraceae bacterium]
MTTQQLYYLITIVEQSNLSKASKVLGISQPALSKFLSAFEESIGFPVFLRYRNQLTPTAIGEYILECVQKILAEQTRMQQTIRALTDRDHLKIRLATAPNRGAIIYSRIYNAFSRRFPEVSLSLTELYASEQAAAIARGQIDIAIGSGVSSDKVTDIPIAYEELLVSLPVSHPLAGLESIKLADLADTPFVLQGERHSIRILAEKLFEQAGFNPVIVFESNDVMLVDSMLHHAVGAGLVSQAHVFPRKELVYKPLNPPVHQTLHIRYPLGHTLTEPEKYLAGLLSRERLSDSRYSAIQSGTVDELVRCADKESDVMLGPSQNIVTGTSRSSHRSTSMINLNMDLLPYFIAIVDEKSLTRAAEKFYMTQPALSRHLRSIEHKLSTQLFSRVHNRLLPTNAGKVFVNSSRNILQIHKEMEEHLHSYRVGHGGGIYLACEFGLGDFIKAEIEPKFKQMFPEVNLVIRESDRNDIEEALQNASGDLGIYFSCSQKHPVLTCHSLATTELVYCVGDQVVQEGDKSTMPMNRSHAPHPIMLCQRNSSLRKEQIRIFSEIFDSPADIVCEARINVLCHLVSERMASTILPLDLLEGKGMERIRFFEPGQMFYLILSCHPDRNLPHSADKLVKLINQEFQHYFVKGE